MGNYSKHKYRCKNISVIILLILLLLIPSVLFAEEWSWDKRILQSTVTPGSHDKSTTFCGTRSLCTCYGTSGLYFAKSTDNGETWTSKVIDSAVGVGNYCSIDYQYQNIIAISYYDNSGDNLKFARSIDGGNSWEIQTLDSGGDVGRYTSIEIAAGIGPDVYLAYSDVTNGTLKFIKSSNLGQTWGASIVVDTIAGGQAQYNNLVFGSDYIYITYYDTSNTQLKLARSADNGITFPSVTVIDNTADTGQYCSISVDRMATPSDDLYVFYYNATSDNLKMAYSSDAGFSFTLSTVDTVGDVGNNASGYVNTFYSPPFVSVAYQDDTNNILKYAYSLDLGTTWQIQTVDDIGNTGNNVSMSATQDFAFIKYGNYTSSSTMITRLISFNFVPKTVQNISGISVATTPFSWSRVKDASLGDNLERGLPATPLYLFDGINWDRARGDITYGLDVDVTRVTGNVSVIGTVSDDSINSSTKLPVIPARANVAAPTWGEGKQVPLSVDLAGNLRILGSVSGTVTGNQGTANTQTNRWPMFLSDGTNERGTTTNALYVQPGTGAIFATTPDYSGSSFYTVKMDNITTASVNLAFGFTSKKVVIEVPPANTDEVCIDWLGGTAVCPAANTAGDDKIPAGRLITIDDMAMTSLSVIAASGTQTIYVRAWR